MLDVSENNDAGTGFEVGGAGIEEGGRIMRE